jgi:hypothetical protein
LIVLERETGLEEVAETGVMIHGDVSADLLNTIFMPRSALHDGAVIIRDDRVVAAGAVLPLAETSIHTERFGTRHRAALGITEQTDAVVIVVSEENGQISLVERARIVRNLTEVGLNRAIRGLLDPAVGRPGTLGWRAASEGRAAAAIGSRRLADMTRFVRRTRLNGGFPPRPTMPGSSSSSSSAAAASPGLAGPASTTTSSADEDENARSSAARVAP